MKTQQTLLKKLCQLFLYDMTYTKKLTKHSLKAYSTDLRDLFHFQKTEKLLIDKISNSVKVKNKKQLEQIIKAKIEKRSFQQKKLAFSSQNRKLATVKSFIKWLAEKNHIEEDFRHLFKSSKIPYRIPFFLSIDEIFNILEVFNKEKNEPHTARNQALFYLLYGAGLRVSEACHIKHEDVDKKHRIIKVTGKGKKERFVSLPEKAMNSLEGLNPNQLFLFGPQALSERKAYNIIKSIGQKAGLLRPLHPHALRHSFATHMLVGGSNLRILQELLGHKSLLATQKYTHLDLSHLSQTLENCHPLKGKKPIAC